MNRISDDYNYSCVIVDDDPFIQDLLQDKLLQYFPHILIKGIAGSGLEGIEEIKKHNPELVFLDVELSDMTGFEMLDLIDNKNFQTIFITSYNHYAIKAIRVNALDYLLKPFDLEELKAAIERFQEKNKNLYTSTGKSSTHICPGTKSLQNGILSIRTQKGLIQLSLKDIVFMKAENNYTLVHIIDGSNELFSKTIKEFEKILGGKGFFRCHKSFLINEEYRRSTGNNGYLQLSSGHEIPLSRRKRRLLKKTLSDNID